METAALVDYESLLQRFYESFLLPGMLAVDVGANVGRHAFEMLRLVGPAGRVVMFEPIPELHAALAVRLQSDEALRQRATLYPFALSDVPGQFEFCLALDDLAYSGFRERRYGREMRVEKIDVEARRLDDLLAIVPRLDYIKIDTEGAEWNVLRGARDSIRRCRPVVSFEFGENSYAPYGVDPDAVWQFFTAENYALFDICGRALGKYDFAESSVRQAVWDYLALPAERCEDLAATLRHNAAAINSTGT